MTDLWGGNYLTASQVAQKYGVSKPYVCRLAKDGKLRHERTPLGYLFLAALVAEDWDNLKHHRRQAK